MDTRPPFVPHAKPSKLREMLAARLNRGNDDDGTRSGDVPDDAVAAWDAPTMAAPTEAGATRAEVNAYVPLPGSKSLTGRELVLSALAREE